MKSLFSFLLLLLAAAVQAASSTGSRLLVILNDVADKEKYSTFLGDLTSRGFDIEYETPKSESLTLFHLGERTYDHVLVLPTKIKGLGPNLTPNKFVDFMNANGNIMVALSSDNVASSSITALLTELDISLPADRTGLVVDHFNYDVSSAADKHDTLLVSPPKPLKAGVKGYFTPEGDSAEPVVFPHGVGHLLGQGHLLNPVLKAPDTAYSYNPQEQADGVDPADLFAAGSQLGLVSTFQARNSARFTLVGSADMLTDKWFDAKVKPADGGKAVGTWNREFAKRISGWTFQEIGVVRVNWIEHHLNEAGEPSESNPHIYRVNNNVTFTISLSEYTWNTWVPYQPPAQDAIQLEFAMLSAFHRLDLTPVEVTPNAAAYSASFTIPSQHGIFNFLVNYKRPFVTSIDEKVTVTVRHLAHNEFTRSYDIVAAWPWIGGIVSTIVGFLAFSAVFMYSKPTNLVESKKKQ
ncbi:related to oligosaccharyltransferase 48K subunit [Cephalotrichum gorgonifer]|uniref:Dolichyl-diphosphooligosaccharide--protein glycosyltransferase subunit WBP1 n=1 Tax=Cephalotrichum gorgonifer TaxID=2041049 RepID=A0AAE8ST61_9PEZI|nr:related to oligosaccharyltransferase 48K subunit [Cephalotrichum gorgonifer]